MVEALTLVFPRGSLLSHTNDNYLNGPTVSLVNQIQLDPQCQDRILPVGQKLRSCQTLNKPLVPKTLSRLGVCFPVVNPVRTVLSHGHSQKKGVGPGNCLNKIKHVKGVCCVNPCIFAPSVPNVPNAVAEQNVGGRLQKFWHIWLEMGANPRVVSVLRDGYTLPFKQRPPYNKGPFDSKRLCKPHHKHVPKRSPGKSHAQVGSGKGGCQLVPGLLQPTFSSSQTQQEMEANLRSKSAQFVPQYRHLQNGNSGDYSVVLDNRGVGRLLPHPNCTKAKKVSQVLPVQSDFPVHSPAIRTSHSSPRVYQGGQRSETHGSSEGYQDPPVPRRLVTESPFPGNLPTTYPDPLGPMLPVRLDSEYDQIRVQFQVFNFVGYRFDLVTGRVLPTPERWETLQEKLRLMKGHQQCTVRQFMSIKAS